MTGDEHRISDEAFDAWIAHVRAERAAAGKPRYIENPAVYALLAAIADSNGRRTESRSPRDD